MNDRALLMIPGPVEVSPGVLAAAAEPPGSHVSPSVIGAFGRALGSMRSLWGAPADGSPVVVSGSGSLAMELAIWNVVAPGDPVLVVETGYFGDRMAQILARRGADVVRIGPEHPLGAVAAEGAFERLLRSTRFRAVACTHVDTSTGVRNDVDALVRAAKAAGSLAIVDGVCSVGGERLDMAACGADVVLTASQKAIGAPPGLALAVFSAEAVAARDRVPPPPLYLDLQSWLPILQAYEAGRPSYFATPPTSLVAALDVALGELDPEESWARHERVGAAMRRAWAHLGLEPLGRDPANTLSALRYPDGIDPTLLPRISARGVTVAGGLLPGLQGTYFRVGHMGWVTGQPELLARTVRAVGLALQDLGHRGDVDAAVAEVT